VPLPTGEPATADAARHPLVWVCPGDPGKSLFLGTSAHAKSGGLGAYDLGGRQVAFLAVGPLAGADLRTPVTLAGKSTTLVAAGRAGDRAVHFFAIDHKAAAVRELPGSLAVTAVNTGPVCLYRSPSGLYVLVGDSSGKVEQWRLDTAAEAVRGTLVRTLTLGGGCTALIADDQARAVFIGEAGRGVWRYAAEPDDKAPPALVDSPGAKGNLPAEATGLAIHDAGGGEGWLIASCGGAGQFVAFGRRAPHAYAGTFAIGGSPSVDGCTGTRGIASASASLGAAFPRGLLVAHDADNQGAPQNFKVVPWESIARTLKLRRR
jgi:3-phytase